MKYRLLGLALTLGFTQMNVACHPKKKNKAAAALPAPVKYFYHGEPEELIAGTVSDNSGLISPEAMASLNGYELVNYVVFARATDISEKKQITSQAELEDSQNTSDASEAFVSNYSFVQDGANITYKDSRPEASDWPVFNFVTVNGKLVMKGVSGFGISSLHYSVKPDNEGFSILAKASDETGTTLLAVTFIKNKEEKTAKLSLTGPENYFVTGDGAAIGWKRDIAIDVCGKDALSHQSEVEMAMAAWSKAGGFEPGFIGKNRYTVAVKADARPFSDLNQNCVNFVDAYKMEDQDNLGIEGVTFPAIDTSDQELINAHIFMFNHAMNRFGSSRMSVLEHELGHLLGLGHEFSTTKKTALPSIMGYGDITYITDADKGAIKNLYNNAALAH